MQDVADASTIDTIELAVPVRMVHALIDLAHDIQSKTESTLFGDDVAHPDEVEFDVIADRGTDPAELVFRTLIEDLPDNAQTDLVALMWLGRGDGTWQNLRIMASARREIPAFSCLRGTPLVAEYLAAGLGALAIKGNGIAGYPV